MDERVDLAQLRKTVGMVFQRPNPLPLSIRDNVLFAHRIHGSSGGLSRAQEEVILEESLRTVLLWDDVKDRLNDYATGLSLEAQQKLCIARLIPLKPSVSPVTESFLALSISSNSSIVLKSSTARGSPNISATLDLKLFVAAAKELT